MVYDVLCMMCDEDYMMYDVCCIVYDDCRMVGCECMKMTHAELCVVTMHGNHVCKLCVVIYVVTDVLQMMGRR